MERPKFVLGLKADNINNDLDGDSDGDFFNSDSDDDGKLPLTGVMPLIPTVKKISSVSLSLQTNKIENFTEASVKITSIVSSFEEIKIPKKSETVYIVPETPATQEIDVAINKFIKGDVTELEIEDNAFDDNICAQLAIIKHSKSMNEPIKVFEKSGLL